MANRRKNIDELKANGTFAKNRSRYAGVVAVSESFIPLGEPPEQLMEQERDAWEALLSRAVPKTLAQSDFVLMTLAARLTAKLLWEFDAMTDKDKGTLQSVMRDLGMSPVSRARLTPARKAPEPNDNLAKFIAINSALNPSQKRTN